MWFTVTRFGEAQILLPAMLLMALWLSHARAQRLALTWLGCTAAAATLTTITKVAFIGWGIGIAPLDFTGISGHAMFAACIYPVLLRCMAASAPPRVQVMALWLGLGLALLVAVSRVTTGAHSVSECVIAFALGGAASLCTLAWAPTPPAGMPAAPRLFLLVVAVWFLVMPAKAPPSTTHGLVTRLSLALSGHDRPYTRIDMLRQYRRQQTAPGVREAVQVGQR